MLLPALTRVVDVLQGWLLLAAQDQADWQQAKAGHADLARIAGVARAGGGDGGAASDAGVDGGVSQTAAADLLTAWGAVERLPSTAAATAAAAAGVEDARVCRGSGMGVSDPPHAPPALQQQVLAGLFGGSNLLGAGGTHQLQHGSSSSSTPHCLLLSGHGPEGQSEVAAATLKLLESRAGELMCAYTVWILGWQSALECMQLLPAEQCAVQHMHFISSLLQQAIDAPADAVPAALPW